jgi:hypothetical protein
MLFDLRIIHKCSKLGKNIKVSLISRSVVRLLAAEIRLYIYESLPATLQLTEVLTKCYEFEMLLPAYLLTYAYYNQSCLL